MPIYEYQCDECTSIFEKMKKRSDPEPAKCPDCGAPEPRRIISRTGFQLKGGGWYVTDYKSGSSRGKPAPPAKAESGDGGSTKSESGESASSSSDSSDPAPASKEVA